MVQNEGILVATEPKHEGHRGGRQESATQAASEREKHGLCEPALVCCPTLPHSLTCVPSPIRLLLMVCGCSHPAYDRTALAQSAIRIALDEADEARSTCRAAADSLLCLCCSLLLIAVAVSSPVQRFGERPMPQPMTFEIQNVQSRRISHCGVLEFSADQVTAFLPKWVRKRAGVGGMRDVRDAVRAQRLMALCRSVCLCVAAVAAHR